jgi:hypothetical protein
MGQIRPLTQRRFSDIIGFLDLYGLINARVGYMKRPAWKYEGYSRFSGPASCGKSLKGTNLNPQSFPELARPYFEILIQVAIRAQLN